MPLPLSKSKIGQLGLRLIAPPVSADDLELFETVMDCYDECQVAAKARVEALLTNLDVAATAGFSVTGRTKTTTTIRDKLRRNSTIKLPYIRDIAGVRVVGAMTLGEQDLVAAHLRDSFGVSVTANDWIDRRASPIEGYRALHVVVTHDGIPVEVQIRTELQARWADLYEAQADRWGRQIRYSALPDPDVNGVVSERLGFLDDLRKLSLLNISDLESVRNTYAGLRTESSRLDDLLAKAPPERVAEIKDIAAKRKPLQERMDEVLAELTRRVQERLQDLADRSDRIL